VPNKVTQATQTPAGTQYTQKSTMAGTKKAANKATKKSSGSTRTPWVSSKAKKLLRKDIIEGRVTIEMDPLYVYGMRDEYMEYGLRTLTPTFLTYMQ
jgi:hypothetical protein